MGFEEDKKRQTDLDDLNNETAGRDVGREARFLGVSSARELQAKREKADREFRSLLQERLQDPEYKRLYDDASSALDSAQSAMDRAMLENARAKERLERLTSELEERAAELDNGEKVFRAADGGLYTANGRKLSAAEARDIEIPEAAPSYEQYRQAREALDGVRKRERDLGEIQTKQIDPARDRLQDKNNPMSEDELREMSGKLRGLERGIPQTAATDFQKVSRQPQAEADEPVMSAAAVSTIPAL